MIDERDLWRTAYAMIETYCNDAPIQAEMRGDDCLAKGDVEGQRAWQLVLAAIKEIRRSVPATRERID